VKKYSGRSIVSVPVFTVLVAAYFLGSNDLDESVPTGTTSSPEISVAAIPTISAAPTQIAVPTEVADPTKSPAQSGKVSDSPVLTQLANLEIKGRAPKTGYDRDLYGSAWSDVDRNGCDTRNDILQRDLTNITFRSGTGNCVVESGSFYDPYTDNEFQFIKSASGSSIEIDHVVSLSDSWQKGAQQWNSGTRKDFANDPLNLVTTSMSANRAKSDSDAASWLPANKKIRCAFVARQVAIKSAYQLWVTQSEYDAIERILLTCPNQPVATSGTLNP
jgi:hypothetical protein